MIQWLQTEVVPDGWFVKGSNFSDILLKYFKVGVVTRSGCEKSHLTHTIFFSYTLLPSHFLFVRAGLLSLKPLYLRIYLTDPSSVSVDGNHSVSRGSVSLYRLTESKGVIGSLTSTIYSSGLSHHENMLQILKVQLLLIVNC